LVATGTVNERPARESSKKYFIFELTTFAPILKVYLSPSENFMVTAARTVRAPRGTSLTCKGWPREAALRSLEALLVQSGRPVGVFQTHAHLRSRHRGRAPRRCRLPHGDCHGGAERRAPADA